MYIRKQFALTEGGDCEASVRGAVHILVHHGAGMAARPPSTVLLVQANA